MTLGARLVGPAGLCERALYGSGVVKMMYRGREVGTADEAGAICGVPARTYQYYVGRLGAPDGINYRDPATGKKLYDLAKVKAWHEARPGKGARTDLTKKTKRQQQVDSAQRDEAGRFAPKDE